jgi:hypothetical protein
MGAVLVLKSALEVEKVSLALWKRRRRRHVTIVT